MSPAPSFFTPTIHPTPLYSSLKVPSLRHGSEISCDFWENIRVGEIGRKIRKQLRIAPEARIFWAFFAYQRVFKQNPPPC